MCVIYNLFFKRREEEQEYILTLDLTCTEKLWKEVQEGN